MPELPEVETVKRSLEKVLQLPTPQRIHTIVLYRKNLRFAMPSAKKLQELFQSDILTIKRRAKYLIFETNRSQKFISHLGMTGTWRWVQGMNEMDFRKIKQTHDHISIQFEAGLLVFNDPRRFGIFDYFDSKYFDHLGPEPLETSFNAEYLFAKTRGKSANVKSFIMNQEVVVGVGNIYASEALFRAGIRPTKMASRVTFRQCEELVFQIQKVLREAIKKGGSTISDFSHVDEQSGYFQHSFQVYDRQGEPCVKCKTKIKNTILSGRSSYWCPSCQK